MATQGVHLSSYDKSKIKSAKGKKVALVVSSWNAQITQNLQKGAVKTLVDLGVESNDVKCFAVPGSFELIFGAKKLCESKYYDAVIVIGSVIKGETAHFDYVCSAVSQGIKDLNVNQDTPVIFCVLTDNNLQQSLDRSGGKHGNKGVEAAVTAVEMIHFSDNAW
ncbi:MAG: 6,7-dimethyl-8-ribityllumazine synthase [Flavobacteriaceae bacterium]|nr:MAG: 6,7-dimethyl-8-ribityllumazine synthase [Flavobacteriaceae bacterium]